MATKHSNGTGGGNSSSGSTWVGGTPPGSSDDIIVDDGDHVVVDTDTTWNSFSVSQTAGTCTLELATNIKLTIKASSSLLGRLSTVSSRLQFIRNPGSELHADTTAGDIQLLFGKLARMDCNGTGANPVKFTQSGANKASFAQNGDLYGMHISGTGHVIVTGWTGDPVIDWPNSLAAVDPATDGVQLTNWKFDGCGEVKMAGAPAGDMPFTFKNGAVINSVASGFCFQYGRGAAVGANADISGTVFEGEIIVAPDGVNLDDIISLTNMQGSGTGKASSNVNAIYSSNASADGSGVNGDGDSDYTDCILWHRNASLHNPHWTTYGGRFDRLFTGNVFFQEADDDEGDCMPLPNTPASPVTLTVTHNILTKSGTTGCCGDFYSGGNPTSNLAIVHEHNTAFVDFNSPGVIVNEVASPSRAAGQCTSWKMNILVGHNASLPSGVHIYQDPAAPSSGVDWVLAADADYNCRLDLTAGLRGNGYDFIGTGTPGAHDINADPTFVDTTVTPLSWAQTIDGSITTNAGVVALLKTKNDFGTDSRVADAGNSLWAYARAGYTPTNPALLIGPDGYLGAVSFSAGGIPAGVLRRRRR